MNDKALNGFKKIISIVIFTKVFFLASALPILLRLFSLPSIMKFLTPAGTIKKAHHREIDLIVKTTNKILGINFFIYYPTCLKKSLILYHFLRKAGVNVVIHFGVRKNEGVLDGHSWITENGKRVYDNLDTVDDFSVTYSYPSQ